MEIAEERLYPTPYAASPLLPLLLLSLARQKHTPNTKNVIRPDYDFIVVGGGSAGSALAARLSEIPCVNVLLLEAGKSPPRLTEVPSIARSFVGTDIDWNYLTTPQKHTGGGLVNRQLQWPSGKAIGGSGIHNGMVYVRGNRKNYDGWAAGGATGWSYADVLPYFKKLEDSQAFMDPEFNGFDGPITASFPAYNPAIQSALFDAAINLGYPIGDSNAEQQYGFFEHTASIRDGQRCSAAKGYLVPAENRTNLDIVENAFVTKIIIRKRRAIGVEVNFQGELSSIFAKREVIVTAGTVNTAQILLLSGLGPRQHLESLNIPVIADLPVGLNFQDHCATFLPYTLSDNIPPFLTKISHPFNVLRYIVNRKGPVSSNEGVFNIAFLTIDPNPPGDVVPDFQLFFLELPPPVVEKTINIRPDAYDISFRPNENKTIVACLVQQNNVKSKGSITLNSANPYDPPVIDPNYFSNDQDLYEMVEGMKTCSQIMSNGALSELDVQPFKTPFPGCDQFRSNLDLFFRCQAKAIVVTLSHPIGTAKMGNPSDPTTVVDPLLRVKGIQGLRVADASVMPFIVSGNTNIPTIMIAEKASDIIKDTVSCY